LRSIGGAERIVRTYLDDGLTALPPGEQKVAARIFRYLVTPSGTKIALADSDLAEYASVPPQQLHPVLDRLAREEWILRRVAPPFPQVEPRYEIVHDYLAPAVLRWRERYLAERERLRRRRRVVVASAIAAVAAAVGFAVLGIQLAHQTDKAEIAQQNLDKGILRPGDRGTPVKNAQYLLSGNNAFRERYYPGPIDGIFGPSTVEAVGNARYWLGYPRNAIRSTYDAQLGAFLVGTSDLPSSYAARRATRRRVVTRPSTTTRTTTALTSTASTATTGSTTTLPTTVTETTTSTPITTAPAPP
jgi:hypothetical protein